MTASNNNGVSTPRLSLEDTLHGILDNVQQVVSLLGLEIGDHGSDRVSSITVENMARGAPKVTTKLYAGSPFGRDDVDLALDVHAYACRESERRQKEEWVETLEEARRQGRGSAMVLRSHNPSVPEETLEPSGVPA